MRNPILVLLPLLFLAACSKKQPTPAPQSTAQPDPSAGYSPPPLRDLVAAAEAEGPPKNNGKPYKSPEPVEVPEIVEQDLTLLPKSDAGLPILSVAQGISLEVDTSLSDPITALGACLTLVTGCIQPPSFENARSMDACVASSKTCATREPWREAEACCPESCQELYVALRKNDYSESDAWVLVGRSLCVPGLQEFMVEGK